MEGKVIALPALPRCPETVNTLGYWHQGIKITDGIRVANHLTWGWEMSLDYPGRPDESKGLLYVEEGGRENWRDGNVTRTWPSAAGVADGEMGP